MHQSWPSRASVRTSPRSPAGLGPRPCCSSRSDPVPLSSGKGRLEALLQEMENVRPVLVSSFDVPIETWDWEGDDDAGPSPLP